MATTPRLELKPSQSLQITPRLRQAIELLQMSNLELQEIVAKELETNPLLEKEDDRISQTEISEYEIDSAGISSSDNSSETETNISEETYDENDFGSDREGYEGETDYGWEDYARNKNRQIDEDYDYFEKKLSNRISLHNFLQQQINLAFSDRINRTIAEALCEQLDEAGYFRGDISETAKRLKISENQASAVLKEVKKFEPTGIFANSLEECLSLQLKEKNRLDPMMKILLKNLELLAAGKIKELKKACACDDEDLASMIADIKSLNPKPTAGFEHDITTYVIPDVFVRTNKYGEYLIEINQMSLPRILINRDYYSKISKTSEKDKKAERYLKERLNSASFIIRALRQRATTILRVSEEIVRRQRDFFEHGIEHLKPMGIKDIAEALELHESTISRVTSGKYMHTPRGLFELKYFFTNAAGSYIGKEDTSTEAIRYRIKKLIDEEVPGQVLSDDKIAEVLAESGTKIARRTVAKYREAMNIPSSAERKRQKLRSL